MNLRQLEIFLKVTESGSFLSAANRLFMSQSAVSQQIIRMEQELGFSLFYRNGHGTRLTDAGVLYASAAREMLRIHRSTIAACIGSEHDGLLINVGCSGYSSYHYLPEAIQYVQDRYPHVHIVTCRIEPPRVEAALESKEVDLVFLPEQIAKMHAELKYQHVADSPLYCVMRRDHPLSGKNTLKYHDLLDSTFVMPYEKYCAPQIKEVVSSVQAIAETLPSGKGSVRIRQGSDIDNALLQILNDRHCVAVVPAYTLPAHSEIVSVPIEESRPIGIGFVHMKTLTLPEEELLRYCQKAAQIV